MTVAPSPPRFVGLVGIPLALGCGSSGGNGYGLDVGSDDGGAPLILGSGDASAPGALDAHIERNHITVTFVTLSCTGQCADVVAVPTGGQKPYTFKWENGSTSASRHVCPASSTSYSVKVTDTGTSGELARAAQTVQVPLEANVISCPDGGVADAGAGGLSSRTPPSRGPLRPASAPISAHPRGSAAWKAPFTHRVIVGPRLLRRGPHVGASRALRL